MSVYSPASSASRGSAPHRTAQLTSRHGSLPPSRPSSSGLADLPPERVLQEKGRDRIPTSSFAFFETHISPPVSLLGKRWETGNKHVLKSDHFPHLGAGDQPGLLSVPDHCCYVTAVGRGVTSRGPPSCAPSVQLARGHMGSPRWHLASAGRGSCLYIGAGENLVPLQL